MVLIKHKSLKSDIFFIPIFIPGFSGPRFFRVRVQVLEVALRLDVFWLHFFFSSVAFLSSIPFRIIRCTVKLLITFSTYFSIETQLKKENLKSVFWVREFGSPNLYNGLPNGLDMSQLKVVNYFLKTLRLAV